MAFRYTRAKGPGAAKAISDFFGQVGIGLCLVYTVSEYAVWPSHVQGDSMMPALHNGDYLLSDKVRDLTINATVSGVSGLLPDAHFLHYA